MEHFGLEEEQELLILGSGCDSVFRAVASDARGPWFEYRHWPKVLSNINCQLY